MFKNIFKVRILIILLVPCQFVLSQSKDIFIYNANGSRDIFDVSKVDSITFVDAGVADIDGNTYQTVLIGNQRWMAENLKVTHYRNGDAIPNVTDAPEWSNLTTGAYCNYDNDANNAVTYGSLYNWYAVNDSRNIAPEGWHVPSDVEWQTLVDYLGGYSVAGGKMKETGTTHWNSPNTGATNESGFSALPGGYRHYATGGYSALGTNGYFWSSTEEYSAYVYYWFLYQNYSFVTQDVSFNWQRGFSVRCVRD
ncbi:MAG: fibrobacter succinogenes major paralogous domain-containing protein [Candidatus Marinimicrobia bacterium]|nr:fibrobacter succinogenes major paralogous domain-containing protein [Candidatus Neomarinimicrobiota bacterium]